MPYTLGTVTAKDANLVNQSIATAQGAGTSVDPFVPAHADIGLGAIDDAPATSNTADATLISLFKRLLNVTLSAIVSLLTDMDAAIGDPGDAAATTDTGNFSLISLLKRLLVKTGGAGTAPTDYTSVGNVNGLIKSAAGAIYAIEAVNLNAATRYLQIYDQNIAPAGIPGPPTGTPLRIYPVYGNSGFLLIDTSQFGPTGLELTTAISWAMSTTATTYTAATGTDTIVAIRYT
jgi:hypothetical protein